jgi:hypothetical protein
MDANKKRTEDCQSGSDFAFFSVIRGSSLSLLAALLIACAHHQAAITIAPHSVVSTGASFDNNTRNSGLISSDQTGFLVTQHFIDRHGLTATSAGVKTEGSNFRITAQVLAECVAKDQARKNQQH